MRIALTIILGVLILVLGFCSILANRSKKPIGKSVAMLVGSLIPPVIGNLFIIASAIETLTIVGCYIYFIGMDLVMVALLRFTFDYCGHTKHRKMIKWILYTLLALDTVQLLINIGTGHAFTMEAIQAYGYDYYRFAPHIGQTIHRVLDYFILGGVLINLIIKAIRTPKIYAEKYIVIIIAMIAVAAWQTFYIFSRTPVDISMIGFGVFGVFIFLLSIYYRPLRLLDRMLAAIASRMPEALFFFDKSERCIWVNQRALQLLNITNDDLDNVLPLLRKLLGDYEKEGLDWESNYVSFENDEIESYSIEKRAIIDDKNHIVGSVLSVRDTSEEQRNLQREAYNASHDALTGALNRAGYDALMREKDLSSCFLLALDIDSFKETNDDYGHTIGDRVLVKFTEILTKNFRDDDYICRIGGDEFVIIMMNANENTPKIVEERIKNINNSLQNQGDGLPDVTVSAGGAFGKDAVNGDQLFNKADKALYETKANGKRGFTLYKNK